MRQLAPNMGMGYHRSLLLRYLDTFPPRGRPVWPEILPEFTPEQIDMGIAAAAVPYGTPDEVERSIQQYADAGVDQVVFGLLSSTMGASAVGRNDRDLRQARAPEVRQGPGAPLDKAARGVLMVLALSGP